MKPVNLFIIYLALGIDTANGVLAFTGQKGIELYYCLDIIIFLVLTVLFTNLPPKSKRALDFIGGGLFGVFLVTVAFKVVNILSS